MTLDPTKNYSFLVAQTAGTPNVAGFAGNISTANATGAGSFAEYVSGGGTLSISTVGNDVYLNATVPEPVTVLGIAAAGMGLAGWVRRRRGAQA